MHIVQNNSHKQTESEGSNISTFILFCFFAHDKNDSKTRAPGKDRVLFPRMPISSSNPMFDHLLESSHRDDSNKWSNIGFGEEKTQVESIEVNSTNLIWSSENCKKILEYQSLFQLR